MVDKDMDVVEISYPNLKADLMKCFENNTKLKVYKINISHHSELNAQLVTPKKSAETNSVFTIKIEVLYNG